MWWTRKGLKQKAWNAFKRNYWMCVLVSIIAGIASAGANASTSSATSQRSLESGYSMNPGAAAAVAGLVAIIVCVAFLLKLLVGNPLQVGTCRFFAMNDQADPELGELLYSFRNNYGDAVLAMFLTGLFTFLWSLLLIVPGIIKAYSYRMVPYILSENPDMSATEVITRSREMMDGNKWDTFLLDLSFIGWILLGILTLGLGLIFWVNPYMNQTQAELYLALSGGEVQSAPYSYDTPYDAPYDALADETQPQEDFIEPMIPLD